MSLLALRTMTAAGVITLGCMVGSAAACITKFHRGCARFTVAGSARAVPVLLATCAGVQGCRFVFVIGFYVLLDAGCVS